MTVDWVAFETIWQHEKETLGKELYYALLGITEKKARMYEEKKLALPEHLAKKMIVLKELIDSLENTYTKDGIKRWFTRPRLKLTGEIPAHLLLGHWEKNMALVNELMDIAKEHRIRTL